MLDSFVHTKHRKLCEWDPDFTTRGSPCDVTINPECGALDPTLRFTVFPSSLKVLNVFVHVNKELLEKRENKFHVILTFIDIFDWSFLCPEVIKQSSILPVKTIAVLIYRFGAPRSLTIVTSKPRLRT